MSRLTAPPDPGPPWRPIATAPRDGSCIWGRTAAGFELRMCWTGGLLDTQGRDCGGWIAWVEGAHPPCWTDATCWAENDAGQPSDPPLWWCPTEAD